MAMKRVKLVEHEKQMYCGRCFLLGTRDVPATNWNGYGHGLCDPCVEPHDQEVLAEFAGLMKLEVEALQDIVDSERGY